jgi:acetyltransferase-like isoleucine patch superfamily enzyme
MKALQQVGLRRLVRFLWASVLLLVLRCAFVPPIRALCLRLFGASIGPGSIVHRCSFINVDRGGFGALSIGRDCFVGDEVLFDLAAPIVLEDQVTLATRVMVLTHVNVGYGDHPLQSRFPAQIAAVRIGAGSFLGAGAIVLCGVTIGPEAFVAAASLVNHDVAGGETVGGVPARTLARGAAS